MVIKLYFSYCWFLLSALLVFQKDLTIAPYSQTGKASYYSSVLEGKPTASGEPYNGKSYTAAHKTLPFGTMVNVTNLENGKEVIVKINDRGPFTGKRIIDLSYEAAKALAMRRKGVAKVRIVVVEPATGYTVADSIAIK